MWTGMTTRRLENCNLAFAEPFGRHPIGPWYCCHSQYLVGRRHVHSYDHVVVVVDVVVGIDVVDNVDNGYE